MDEDEMMLKVQLEEKKKTGFSFVSDGTYNQVSVVLVMFVVVVFVQMLVTIRQ
jgi:hypothetical protein